MAVPAGADLSRQASAPGADEVVDVSGDAERPSSAELGWYSDQETLEGALGT